MTDTVNSAVIAAQAKRVESLEAALRDAREALGNFAHAARNAGLDRSHCSGLVAPRACSLCIALDALATIDAVLTPKGDGYHNAEGPR